MAGGKTGAWQGMRHGAGPLVAGPRCGARLLSGLPGAFVSAGFGWEREGGRGAPRGTGQPARAALDGAGGEGGPR